MKNFDWLRFVKDCQVSLANHRRIGHLTYMGIEIHPSTYGLFVGAYGYEKETQRDKNLINFFESNGVALRTIITTMEDGLRSSEEKMEHAEKSMYHIVPREALQAAFEKGKTLKELEPDTIFFR